MDIPTVVNWCWALIFKPHSLIPWRLSSALLSSRALTASAQDSQRLPAMLGSTLSGNGVTKSY